MRPDVAVARVAHERRAFFDDVKSVFDDMFGGKDDDKDDDDKKGPGNGPGNGPGGKTTSEERTVVTKTAHTTITRPTITQTERGPPKSTLVVDKETTTQRKGDPLRVTDVPSEISGLPSTQTIPSTLAIAPTTDALSTTRTVDRGNVAASATAGAKNPNPSAVPNTNGGESSTGTKAGIAIGVLAGILAVFLLLWFLFTKRKKQLEDQRLEDDEKINGPFSDSAAIRSPATAPRLSLRPVTQFIPNLMATSEKRTSHAAGAMLNASSAHAAPLNRPAGASAWERPTTNSLNNGSPWDRQTASPSPNSANPFNDSQRIPDQSYQARPVSPLEKDLPAIAQPVSPIEASDALPEFPTPSGAAAGVVAGAALGVAGAGLVRKASMRKDIPAPLDLTRPPPLGAVPPSPAGTEFSVNSYGPGQSPGPSASAADIAAAGGPSQSTVHRVQLDFKPTLQDELELRAGEVVRLLHEYDDGWVSSNPAPPPFHSLITNLPRLCASDLIALVKVLFLEPAYQCARSNQDLHQVPVLVALPSTPTVVLTTLA